MAIFVDKKSKIVVQGATGHQGVFHIAAMKEFGTNVVAGVTPGKGGKFQILEVSFCNEGFDKKTAIPLKASNDGFDAIMNIELTIESEHSLPDIIDVVISVGEKYNKNIQLKKYKSGVFRSIDIQKFSIPYKELVAN